MAEYQQKFQPLQLPTAVAGVLFKQPDVRENSYGYYVLGTLKVAGGGFLSFISSTESAVEILSQCSIGQAVYLHGFVKAGKPYANKKSGEMVGSLQMTVEYAGLIEHKNWQNVRSEKPRDAAPQQPAPSSSTGESEGGDKQEFDDDIPF